MHDKTAAEMWELFHVMPLLIGCYEEVSTNQHYLCFMRLQQIAALILSPSISARQIPFIRILIGEYLAEVKALYPWLNLPPKLHYLVHVPTLIERYFLHAKHQITFIGKSSI